ncbi:steroid 17-alpha-hydroxylase/17,20 lyase [Strongylocentrotus purpuratus]|uniref:Steroid 21-hydroxylase n=1 Tax=Strongylocentrotus purpuratus TaxID=7668 RepID=A0A7M7MX36_STRPU|nr:steroid 17-alpha-hydroxylase/17,20 lyase [Strongylocentrotus purpuratus]XP_030827806.1 steroid 17-alpha-hydroxylase/17,20 lyase [Strongylocentrotus purpuratus]XP_030827807.1 steroid 17-alpha-hydroxylase/17,20 lyase [Strongylocentrotus purpuratus]XP_030827808.1 steroid 17-alpha-hydroxylase/17,20 lyase [Strongylocentrotus purpuratus]XP_030827809.1 steroid 17-alpha-hydroxylase/17,20 lyase [Strongylocentrotus purpuratus]
MIDLLGAGESGFGQFNALTITATLGVVTATLALWTIVRPKRFPPGPRGLPIVGSIFSMNDSPEIVFGEWAKRYGDIFGFKAGERWMVVLNRQALIKEAVLKQGVDFAGRPDFYSLEIFTDGFKDIAFSPYSETWKLHRKLAHTALRHFATGKPLQDLISSVYPKVDKKLAMTEGQPIDPKVLINLIMYNVLAQMCFGRSYELEDPTVAQWMDTNDDLNEKFGLGLAADMFSWARYIPTSGPRMIKELTEKLWGFLRLQVDETRENYDPENINNFYSLLLKAQEDARKEGENVDKLTDTHVFQTISDIFGAGTQTTVETLYWAMALLVTYPEIQAKIRAEIDDVIGRDRLPAINDRGKLPYTEATLYEVLRYSSILPIALPHNTTRDTEFGGYHIPKGTVVMINTHSMHYDPQEWDQPDKFLPEHFMDGSGTVRDHPPSFLPFGAGRRGCLGEAVAKADLFLIFTWFMQNYTFSRAPGKESEDILKMIPQTASGRILLSYEIMINKRD